MCGRYSFVIKKKKLETELDLPLPEGELPEFFNIAPTQNAPVLTNDQPRKLTFLKWGLIPAWSKTGKMTAATFNARMEDLAEKPTFREPFYKKRCLVVADSFYEWRTAGKQKQPFRIFPKQEKLLVMAGLWENWTDGKEKIGSFSIVTAPANREISEIHDRMPLILDTEEKRNLWLNGSHGEIEKLLVAPADNLLEMYPVSEIINSSRTPGSPKMHDKISVNPTLFD